jgi:maltooligosyltrehalose trehalohydrolase
VWAPTAGRVDVDGVAMRRQGDWWESPVDLAAGDRYAFTVDGVGPMPDPRSCFQPDGVHGPSAVVELVPRNGRVYVG